MAERSRRIDVPVGVRSSRRRLDPDAFGRSSERIARFLGTSRFLVYLTLLVAAWLLWNSLAPEAARFDPESMNFTLLTLILSLQASYAAPLILLAQNRQTDRDRISLEEDRGQNARLQAEVDYLARELAALRQALGEVATREYLRDQLRELLEEVVERTAPDAAGLAHRRDERDERERRARKKRKDRKRLEDAAAQPPPGLGEPFGGEDSTD